MKWRWRIRHKLAAGLVLVVGMTGLLAAGAFYGLYSYQRSNIVFDHHHRQLELLGNLDQASSALNFPSRAALEAQADTNAERKEKLERLERIAKLIEKYREGLSTAEQYFSSEGARKQYTELDRMRGYVAQLKESVFGANPSAAANGPKFTWFSLGERDVIAKLIYSLGALRGVIHTEVINNVEADRMRYSYSIAVVYSTSILVVVMLAGLVVLVYRAIFTPIRELHRGVKKLAAGNFNSRVDLHTGDEVQELGDAFNDMADRLAGIYEDLNHQVEQRSRQLIRSERLASVGFLAAGVAHEINNPLASIAFCGEALESRLKKLLPAGDDDAEVVQNYLQMIQQEAFRCKAITERLLDFSRAGEPERIDADVVSLIRNVLEMVQHLGRSKGRTLIFEPTEPVVARVNPPELKQVLLNLVVNALESTDEGGLVKVEAKRSSSGVDITVSDDGCGMSEEVLGNLFEPFFTRNRTGKGTGLGLSISHLIISQHGGSLTANSDGPGKGSKFTITLPTAARSKAAA